MRDLIAALSGSCSDHKIYAPACDKRNMNSKDHQCVISFYFQDIKIHFSMEFHLLKNMKLITQAIYLPMLSED